jgi:hypothetical protein
MGAAFAAGSAMVKGIGKGFAAGGYTDYGDVNKAVGVVHAGEWVAPAWMVKDPRYMSTISGLEEHRQGASGRTIATAERNSPSNGGAPGYFLGGFTDWWQKHVVGDWGTSLATGGLPMDIRKNLPFNFERNIENHNLWHDFAGWGPQKQGAADDTRTPSQIAAENAYYSGDLPTVGNSSATNTAAAQAMAATLTTPGSAGTNSAGIGGSNATPVSQNMNVGFFGTAQDAEQWLSTQRGRRVMIDFMRQHQYELS